MMNKSDLVDFSIKKKWNKARVEFYKEQIENVNRLSAILSDMPKGSRKVYDNESESLVKLMDQINNLIDEINETTANTENQITEQLLRIKPKYRLILYHHYILGDSIKYIAEKIIYNEEKYTYKLKDKAIEEFEKFSKKEKKKEE